MHSYYILLTSCCVVFAAHGAKIPGRNEEAANNVPGKVGTADRGEGFVAALFPGLLSLFVSYICVLYRP